MAFGDAIAKLNEIGVRDVLLPFALIFVIVYTVLEKSKILGEKVKNINIVVSFVFALIPVFAHITGIGPDIIPTLNYYLPYVSLLLVIIICFLIVVSSFGEGIGKDVIFKLLGILLLIELVVPESLIFALLAPEGSLPGFLSFLQDPQIKAVIISVIVFLVLIFFITYEKKE